MRKPYIMDDNFKISEEIESLPEEEPDRRTAILEQKATEEKKNIPEPRLLGF